MLFGGGPLLFAGGPLLFGGGPLLFGGGPLLFAGGPLLFGGEASCSRPVFDGSGIVLDGPYEPPCPLREAKRELTPRRIARRKRRRSRVKR